MFYTQGFVDIFLNKPYAFLNESTLSGILSCIFYTRIEDRFFYAYLCEKREQSSFLNISYT